MDRRKALQRTGLFAGATLLLPSMLSLFESCKTESRLNWQPQFFTEEEAETVSMILDMILPTTDTPGALDVKADVFIDKVIAQTYDLEGQNNMREAITEFNTDTKETYGAIFINLPEAKRVQVLEAAETSSALFNPGIWGTTVGEQAPISFYRTLKSMAIWAYFTSQEIGENVLAYDPIPGIYEPCKPVSEVGNRWSL